MPKPPRTKPTKEKRLANLKAFLKAKGHKAGKADALTAATEDALVEQVLELHGLSGEACRRLGAGPGVG